MLFTHKSSCEVLFWTMEYALMVPVFANYCSQGVTQLLDTASLKGQLTLEILSGEMAQDS